MKLNEILTNPSLKIPVVNKQVSDIQKQSQYSIVGTGAQAIAYLHKKFPNKVIKTIQISGYNDPAYQFLRLVLNHQDNPYFPKIFSAKVYQSVQDEDGRGILFDLMDEAGNFSPPPDLSGFTIFVVMERLTQLNQITNQDLEIFGFEDMPIPAKMKQYKRDSEIKFRMAFKDPKWRRIAYNAANDPNLKRALRLLEPLFRHYEPDMHGDNIMLRGNQWVFMDPVSHNEEGL